MGIFLCTSNMYIFGYGIHDEGIYTLCMNGVFLKWYKNVPLYPILYSLDLQTKQNL